MPDERCPWCGAEELAGRLLAFACGSQLAGDGTSRAEKCYQRDGDQLIARVTRLESALRTIADTHGPGTIAGDAAREGMKHV